MNLASLSDFELAELGDQLALELRHRALLRNDPDVVADEAFGERFDHRGWPMDPLLVDGLLICCGALKSRTSMHRCSFVTVNDEWSWHHDYLADELRYPDPNLMNCVTVLVAAPRMTLTQVSSTCEGGQHRRINASSWVVDGDRLEPIPVASRIPRDHRR